MDSAQEMDQSIYLNTWGLRLLHEQNEELAPVPSQMHKRKNKNVNEFILWPLSDLWQLQELCKFSTFEMYFVHLFVHWKYLWRKNCCYLCNMRKKEIWNTFAINIISWFEVYIATFYLEHICGLFQWTTDVCVQICHMTFEILLHHLRPVQNWDILSKCYLRVELVCFLGWGFCRSIYGLAYCMIE